MPSIGGTIDHCVLVLVLVLRFVIRMCLVLVYLLVDFDYAIFDKSLLKDHAFFFDVFVSLEIVHDHVTRMTWVSIVNEHFDKMMFWEGARDSGNEIFPFL